MTDHNIRSLLPWLGFVVVLHLLPFASRAALIGGDEPHYALLAHSIAADGDFSVLDDYEEVERGAPFAGRKRAGESLERHVREVNGRAVFSHPLGLPLLAAPLLFVLHALAPNASPDLLLGNLTLAVTLAGLTALWSATATRVGDRRVAAVAVLSVYFGSPIWFYSRTFFTEPYTWSFASIALWLIGSRRFGIASLLLALTLALKETSALIVIPLFAYAVITTRSVRAAVVLASGPLLFAIVFISKNVIMGLPPFATFQPFVVGDPISGAAGLFLDQTHGLLWHAPLLCLALLLLPTVAWNEGETRLSLALVAAVFIGYFIVAASWVDWRGGSSYGPRLLIPVLPFLAWPLAYVYMRSTAAGRLLYATLFVAGFVVNWTAALDPFTAFWGVPAPSLLAKNVGSAVAGVVVAVAMCCVAGRWSMRPSAATPTG